MSDILNLPCDVNELWAKRPHAFNTIQEVLQTLPSSDQSGNIMLKNIIHLRGPWWEILERPPYFVVFSGLLDLFTDFHDRVTKVVGWI